MKLLTEKIELPFEDGTGEIIADCAEKRDQLNKSTSKFLDDAAKIVDAINKLDESLPPELATAIKNSRARASQGRFQAPNKYSLAAEHGYKGYYTPGKGGRIDHYTRPEVDFQNSDYTEIEPEEAKSLYKSGQADKILVIFAGQLISFNADGTQDWRANREIAYQNVKSDQPHISYSEVYDLVDNYLFKNGDKRVIFSTSLKADDIFDRATRIYKIDEVPYDDKRRSHDNPMSKYYIPSDDDMTAIKPLVKGTRISGRLSDGPFSPTMNIRGTGEFWNNGIRKCSKNLEKDHIEIKNLKAELANTTDEERIKEIEEKINYYEEEIDYYNLLIADYKNIVSQDRLLRLDVTGNKSLREPFVKYQELKNKADSTKDDLDDLKDDVEKAKKKAKDNKNESLDEDLKIVIGLDDFKPWSGAVDTFNKILEADKMDELDELLEDTYPDGIGETELNDLLWFDSDYILDVLGLAEEEEDEDL